MLLRLKRVRLVDRYSLLFVPFRYVPARSRPPQLMVVTTCPARAYALQGLKKGLFHHVVDLDIYCSVAKSSRLIVNMSSRLIYMLTEHEISEWMFMGMIGAQFT